MKKYVLSSWISFLHFSMHKDCIENYQSRCLFRFPENCTCVNLPAMSGKLAHQYYNLLLPCIIYFFIYLDSHFISKSSWKGVVIISN